MNSPHITIVTFAWPPRNSVGAHRPWSWAKNWSEAGARVRVLTAKKYSYDAPLDLTLPTLPGVEVIEVGYAAGVSSVAAKLYRSPVGPIARKLFQKTRQPFRPNINPREKWLGAVLPIVTELSKDTDVVVSTYDPRTVHQIGAALKKSNPNILWVADYRDLWSLNHAPNWTNRQRESERCIEMDTVAKYADMITSVSEELARRQGAHVGKPWLKVTNGFDVDTNEISTRVGSRTFTSRQSLKIVYTGKIYRELRDPTPLLDTILSMEEKGEVSKGQICLEIYGGQVEGIEEISRSERYEHILSLKGHVPRDVALNAQQHADFLLLLESPRPEARGVLTGKIFEYMASGVPILSLGSRQGSEICRVLQVTRTGLCTEDNEARIRAALVEALAGKKPNWFDPNLETIGGYSRSSQADIMLKALTDQLEARAVSQDKK